MKRIYKAAAGVAIPLSLVAALAAGTPAMAATKTPSSSTSTSSTAVVAAPSLSLAVTSAVAGAQTSVSTALTGKGFPARTSTTITTGTETKYLKTDGSGNFSTTLNIPTTTAGTVTITAKASTTTATTTFTVQAAPAPAATSVSHPLRFGVTTPNTSAAELDQVATVAGEAPSVITFYQDWKQAVPTTQLNAIKNRGATPVIGWEPWQWGATDQSAYSLDNITAGNHDAYITQWAQGLKSYGSPVMLRFGHEMNGNWYPWSEGVNGNGSGDYVAAWKHVHDIFAANGVTNVKWVWNPNVPYYGSTDLASLYPGDAYVDVVALDGYNWGTTQSWGSTWQSPSQLFGEGLTAMRTVAPGKEIMIAETASAEQGGDKAAWNRDLISYLDAQSDVTAVVWFDHNKEVDWRIDSSTTSAAAFKSALAVRE